MDSLADAFIDQWDKARPRGGIVVPDQNDDLKDHNNA
jgi:hypothetical protein